MKKAIPIVLVSVLALAVVSALGAPASQPKGQLDGKTFDVTLVKESGETEGPDQLIFADGTFDSMQCHQYGFTKSSYKTRMEKDAMTFESSATSPKEGTNHWTGTIRGSEIEGTLKWTKEGKTTTYTYKGKVNAS